MTTITSKDLKELSQAAEDGPFWVDTKTQHGGVMINTERADVFFVSADIGTRSSDLIVGTVNAYRAGLLVHVDDIDEQELLDEMRAERDEARGQVEKLRHAAREAAEFVEKARRIFHDQGVSQEWAMAVAGMLHVALDAKKSDHNPPVAIARAALSQGEDGA